jgi:hypothetical protein
MMSLSLHFTVERLPNDRCQNNCHLWYFSRSKKGQIIMSSLIKSAKLARFCLRTNPVLATAIRHRKSFT